MDNYHNTCDAILKLNQDAMSLIQQAETVLDPEVTKFDQWRRSCDSIARQLREHIVQIAVVGAIKSGKSTFVNAILQDDYLKRGAGVVTSIVTRVRRGDQLGARLFFKSWDDINAEIEQALVLFPTNDWRSVDHHFDMRRSQDREDLTVALEALDKELRVAQDSLNANGVLLSSYLKGYKQVEAHVSSDSTTREFDETNFADHRDFVGNDALAVYLKDIQLEVTGDTLSANLEIADCQGSDSPNPLHLAMIQDYLLKAHLIIYVISSRTGVRQADIRFLSMIKRMGIANNMLFICNCDLNEHDSIADLEALVQRIKEELAFIVESPELFTFSALYNLFEAKKSKISSKEKERLAQWRKSRQLVSFSDKETQRLTNVLEQKLTHERYSLLFQNQLSRIKVTSTGLLQWLRLNKDLLHRDVGDVGEMARRLQSHQGHMRQVQSMVQSTLEGAVQKMIKELKQSVDRFFDYHHGPILIKILDFVRNYRVDLDRYSDQLENSGFVQTLYLVYQELKQAMDGYMAEKVNPEIVGFIGQKEKQLQHILEMAADPYEAMVKDALVQYEDALAHFGVSTETVAWNFQVSLNLASIKQLVGLNLPPAAATMRYSSNIKTEAVVRLGFYSVGRALRKLFNKQVAPNRAEERKALEVSIRRMKAETERAIHAHFKDYKENIKFQYMQRLAKLAGNQLYEALTEKFTAYLGDVMQLMTAINDKRGDKEQLESELISIETAVSSLLINIADIEQKVGSLIGQES